MISNAMKGKMRAVVELLVIVAKVTVAQQRERVERLIAQGDDAIAEQTVLEQCEQSLKTYEQDLQRLSSNNFPS